MRGPAIATASLPIIVPRPSPNAVTGSHGLDASLRYMLDVFAYSTYASGRWKPTYRSRNAGNGRIRQDRAEELMSQMEDGMTGIFGAIIGDIVGSK